MSDEARPAIAPLVDDLFRRVSGELVAGLVRVFGPAHIELAEDVVQEALAKALHIWPFQGVPDNPAAWLARVARNLALDRLRRDTRLASHAEELLEWEPEPEAAEASELGDDTLHMIFLCCHPELPAESRVALTLKTVCGFGVSEIARAFLVRESAVAQRLVRAKRRIRERGIEFGLPPAAELEQRFASVLDVLYLLFNEGYVAHQGQDLIREDCVRESLRLVEGLCRHPVTARPEAHAVGALICFHAARSPARTTPDGGLLLLADQDRSRWDRELIGRGFGHLTAAAQGEHLSRYHLEAGVASCHAAAPSFAGTNWEAIRKLYEQLLTLTSSPVARIAHAVAVAQIEGPQAGLDQLEVLGLPRELQGYHVLHATRGALLDQVGERGAAAEAYREALACRCTDPERRFLEERLRTVGSVSR